jgi:hypothetical protein
MDYIRVTNDSFCILCKGKYIKLVDDQVECPPCLKGDRLVELKKKFRATTNKTLRNQTYYR